VRCSGEAGFVPLAKARVEVREAERQPTITLRMMRQLHRAVFGRRAIAIDGVGHATVETIVSTPDAEKRTSRRYRVRVVVTTQSFTLAAPELLEQYEETCLPVHSCHSTHWSCRRR
jgi:hypothetical protein